MISIEAFSLGMHAMLGLSLGIVITLVARGPVLRLFGAQVTYTLWVVIPLLVVISLLPIQPLAVAHPYLVATTQVATHHVTPSSALAHAIPWTGIAASLWLAGAIAIFAASLKGWMTIRRVIGNAKALPSFENIPVLESAHWSHGPAVAGVFRPVIIIPDDFNIRYTEAERRLILAHEATHARRLDALANSLATIIVAMAWLNPLAWLALIRFRRDQELACDASVLSRFKQRKTYGEALLKTHYAFLGPLATCNWLGFSSLKERVMMIKQPHRTKARLRMGLMAVISIAALSSVASHALSTDTAPLQGTILVQIDTTRANGLQQSSVVCVASDQPIQIPYDHGPGDLGNLYFHVAYATGKEFEGTPSPYPAPPYQWHIYGFTPVAHSYFADGVKGEVNKLPDLYARDRGTTGLVYGNPEDLKVEIKIAQHC